MDAPDIIETGIAALLLAAIFLLGDRIHPLRTTIPDRRVVLSFGAGMSAAYVFIKLIPEMASTRHGFVATVEAPLPFAGMAVYFLALLGFLGFYGLDHLRARLGASVEAEQTGIDFKLHLGGFAAYVWLIGYLLVNSLEETPTSLAFYTLAIAFHFLSLDHSLNHEHGTDYQQLGRFVLAAATLIGWLTGIVVVLPEWVLALLLAFISGAVIINSLIMELPSEKDGRFWPFLVGGIVYGLILLPLG